MITSHFIFRINLSSSYFLSNVKFGTSTLCKTSNKPSAEDEDLDMNKPLSFTNSAAHKWKAEYSRRGTSAEPRLSYESHVVSISLTVFLLYFCVFREESDIDTEFSRSLYSRIDGLEEAQLRISYKYNMDNGLDVKDIERRMHELNIKNVVK